MSSLSHQRLGHSLRHLRKTRGLTQQESADLAGLTRKMVIQTEQGQPTVAIGHYQALAEALGAELVIQPGRRPTLDEVQKMVSDD